ncbi:MAG: hypothetical protein US49_C0003G0050 [candidate division TM6 bacterium GW2011_GWF2_37_49]|nr:MAG: hypothetical protein US49_C0003G0050 [candidate division TM6 bacterium GW2011_GWF2_37_49]
MVRYIKEILKVAIFIFSILTENFLFAAYGQPVASTSESFLSLMLEEMCDVSSGLVGLDNKKVFYSFTQSKTGYKSWQSIGDKIIYMYDVKTGQLTGTYNLGRRVAFGPIFSQNAKKMAWTELISDKNYVVKLCDVDTGFNEYEFPCNAICMPIPQFNSDCNVLAWIVRNLHEKNKLYAFDLYSKHHENFMFNQNMIDCVFAPNFKKMAHVFIKPSPKIEGPIITIKLYDLCTLSNKEVDCYAENVSGINICLSGKYLIYKTLQPNYDHFGKCNIITNLCDVDENKIVYSEKNVSFSDFSTNGKLCAFLITEPVVGACNFNVIIKLFNMETRSVIHEANCGVGGVTAFKFSPNCIKLAYLTVHSNNSVTINVYHIALKTIYKTFNCGTTHITCFDFNKEGDQIIAVTAAGNIVTFPI